MDDTFPPTEGRRLGGISRAKTNRERGIRPKRSKHLLHLNRETFAALMRQQQKFSHEAVASYLELGVGTVHGALHGRPVSDAFVSAVLKKVRGTPYRLEDLLVEGDAEQAAA